jgi:hypothetical protein
LSTNHCPNMNSDLLYRRGLVRQRQYELWKDTVQDSIKTPFDTSYVANIDSIGFSILKGPQYGAVTPRTYQPNFTELTASKNPFEDETTLQTSLSEATMLRLEIYDILGKQLYSENRFFTPGEVRWTLDGKSLPRGSLYVRVSTLHGEVKSLKLVH